MRKCEEKRCRKPGDHLSGGEYIQGGGHYSYSCAEHVHWPEYWTGKHEHPCEHCGEVFYTWNHDDWRLKYCTPECRELADKERRQARRQAEVIALRDRLTCEHCGEPVTDAVRSTARFCSGSCRVAAHRARKDGNAKSKV